MPQETDIRAGVLAGVYRFYAEIGQPSDILEATDQAQRISNLIWDVVRNKEKWHPRGVRLFAEVVTIGILSRSVAREEPLNEDQLFRFGDQIEFAANCWFHLTFP
jgi:hypothetical protein